MPHSLTFARPSKRHEHSHVGACVVLPRGSLYLGCTCLRQLSRPRLDGTCHRRRSGRRRLVLERASGKLSTTGSLVLSGMRGSYTRLRSPVRIEGDRGFRASCSRVAPADAQCIQWLANNCTCRCPWTGTGIGRNNMLAFKVFVVAVNVLCYFTIGIVIAALLQGIAS
jgi:hypothetical protein